MTAIAIFIGRLTEMVNFFPYYKKITQEQYAWLFIDQILKLYALPKVIISNCNPRFLSKFWHELFSRVGMDL